MSTNCLQTVCRCGISINLQDGYQRPNGEYCCKTCWLIEQAKTANFNLVPIPKFVEMGKLQQENDGLRQQLAAAKLECSALKGIFEWTMQAWEWSITATPEQIREWKAKCLATLTPPADPNGGKE